MEMILGERGGSCGWTEVVYEACFTVSLKHASLWAEIFKEIEVEGVADGDDPGGKGGSRGWTEVVYEACFRLSRLVSNMLRCGLKFSRSCRWR